MPEAVIVATARSPIGRAGKGSLTSIRPDDLAVQMVSAALAKVPQLDPADIGDLMLGCGLPGGEQGFNMARVIAVLLGYDHLPGTTVNRYCSSSLQTTRMAFHAIKAGEGDVYVSAGVECVSRLARGSSDSWPDTKNPVFGEAKERTERAAAGGSGTWHDPREDGLVPDIYIAMGETAENVAGQGGGKPESHHHRAYLSWRHSCDQRQSDRGEIKFADRDQHEIAEEPQRAGLRAGEAEPSVVRRVADEQHGTMPAPCSLAQRMLHQRRPDAALAADRVHSKWSKHQRRPLAARAD